MKKIGLVLGGGGSKGSYQLGVIKALLEDDLLKDVKVVAGTSIGSFNTCLIVQKLSFEQMLSIWKEITNETIYKEGLSRYKTDKLGLYDQRIMYDILVSKQDPSTLKNSDIKGYAAVTKVNDYKLSKVFKKTDMESLIIDLNEAEDPYKIVLASSSVPLVFGPTEINGQQYLDGGLLNNLPVNAVVDDNCDIIIIIGLSPHNNTLNYDDKLIIDFTPETKLTKTMLGMLDFSETILEKRIEEGYLAAKDLIATLKEESIILNNKWNPKKTGTFYLKNKI